MSEDMQLKWKINQMDCYPEFSGATDYVFNVHWDCLSYYNGPSGGPYYGRTYGVTSVPSSPGPFTPYIDLEETQVFSWVYAAMPSGDKEKFEEGAIQQIVNQIVPPVVTPPNPWPTDIFPIIAPSITSQPQSGISVWSGENVMVSLTAAGQPLYYQWKLGTQDVPQASGATLSISDIQLDQAGSYTATISNSFGSVTSDPCIISVKPPVSPVIVTQPSGGIVNYNNIFGMSVYATGYPTPSYAWSLNGNEISGAYNSTYWINNAQASQAGDYSVKVYNSVGQVVSNTAHLDVIIPDPAAPTILTQPVSISSTLGSMAYFNIVGSGYPPFTYQWYKDEGIIAGATDNILPINNIQESDTGVYTAALTNTAGSTISSGASLSIIS
jgi:hypothetical protein